MNLLLGVTYPINTQASNFFVCRREKKNKTETRFRPDHARFNPIDITREGAEDDVPALHNAISYQGDKVIKNNKDFFDQSLDEIKLLHLLNARDPHDEHNILRMFDYFYHREHLFIVTELLRDNLYEFGKFNRECGDELYFSPARLQKILRQVLEALAFIHSHGVVHCDLKPENILIRSYSYVLSCP